MLPSSPPPFIIILQTSPRTINTIDPLRIHQISARLYLFAGSSILAQTSSHQEPEESMALPWEPYQDILKALWISQNKTYEEVQAEMKSLHNFNASKNQYVAQFKNWGWRKNIAAAEWRSVNKTIVRRHDQGRKSEVYLNNVLVPDAKVRKEISRNVLLSSQLAQVPNTPPPIPDIQIRTPPSTPSANFKTNMPRISTSTSALVQINRKRSSQIDIEPSGCKVQRISVQHRSVREQSFQQYFSATGLLANGGDKLPYYEFQDLFRSLNLADTSLKGKFFDQIPSPSIVPSNPLFLLDIAESEWSLDYGCDNFESEGLIEQTSKQKGIGHFYQSFAKLLIPQAGNQDQLEANKRLQEVLPMLLENMPERYSGERQFVMETLLGPPQLNAALCLLEIVVYLYSNSLVGHYQSGFIIDWIVKTIPFDALGNVLRMKLPTLQAFQCALFLYGIKISSIRFVADLLDLDVGLQDFVRTSDKALKEAIVAGNVEIVKLILGLGGIRYDLSGVSDWFSWRGALAGRKFSVEIARVLVDVGADVCGKIIHAYPDSNSFALTSAISRGDHELTQYLLSVGADVNPGNRESLEMAVTTGQVNLLRLLLDHGADVNAVGDSHRFRTTSDTFDSPRIVGTALQVAAARGYIEMVELLLQAGSAINEPAHGEYGKTALYAAVDASFNNIVELLLQLGATVDAPGTCSSEYPRTALLRAVETDNIAMLNVLLRFGANPNALAFDYHGTTALEAARARKNGTGIVSCLLLAGANDEIRHQDSVRLGYMKVQLVQAITRGDVANIYHLLQMGTEIDMVPIEYGDWYKETSFTGLKNEYPTGATRATILHWAIASEKIDSGLFRHLVGQVKNFSEQNYIDTLVPVLHEAVCRRRTDFVEILLDAGVEVDLVSTVAELETVFGDYSVPTALHIAACQQDFDLVSLLLDRGADINPTSLDAHTPLQLFLLHIQHLFLLHTEYVGDVDSLPLLDLFELFISRGADVSAPPPAIESGKTALQIAAGYDEYAKVPAKEKIVLRLLTLGANVNDPAGEDDGRTALQAASKSGNLDIVMILLDHHAEINAPASRRYGGTALQFASQRGHIKIAQLLLSKGAEVNARGSQVNGCTALQLASWGGLIKMAQLLLSKGAEVNAPGSGVTGKTALQFASEKGHIKIAQLLFSCGAEVNAPSSGQFGNTAIESAAKYGRLDMVQLLLNAGADCDLPLEKRYVSALQYAKRKLVDSSLGVISLLQKHRDRAMEEWNKMRVFEVHPGGNLEDGSNDFDNSSSNYNSESDYDSELEDVIDESVEA
ncbi:Ankyrin [Lachnellula subtilissima]|uniref:Ankyrin n=1 Tax=Lachnellula subtilissima TaxID=602034 RepID=A0A8H8RRT0_9HELO|nr:Ankyrin [Lachnellula subtilissima]